MTQPAFDIEAARRTVPLLERLLPMAHCSHSPQTTETKAAALAYLESWAQRGMDWDAWMSELDGARSEFARLINADPGEIAISSCVSDVTSALASAIDWPSGRDGVVVGGAEFPTVSHIWMAQERYGARVVHVPLHDGRAQAEAFGQFIDERTRIVSACRAYYLNGSISDTRRIAELAHRAGAYIFVDAYQSLGTEPIDVKALDIDFLASGTHKYLFGVPGIAFLYVRRELIARLEPTVTGWFGRSQPFAFDARTLDWAATAARFETGTPPVFAGYVARAGLARVNAVGTSAIREWTCELSRRLVEGGSARGLALHGPADPATRTPTTAFLCADSHAVEARLLDMGVLASARGPVLRLAPHYYNTMDEMDRALDALSGALAGWGGP